ncbi:glucokinase [Lobulomyces angularis]|nr:glucokinase [Lobulomyces angularis]
MNLIITFTAGLLVGLRLAAIPINYATSNRTKNSLDLKMDSIRKEFTVHTKKLRHVVFSMLKELKKGLTSDEYDLKMIPSYIQFLPTGEETGTYLALDLGGTNLRVCQVYLKGKGVIKMKQKKFKISDEIKKASGTHLFDFVADCIKIFLDEYNLSNDNLKMGFTFSFPVEQKSIGSGTLELWNKGFTCEGVVGNDVVHLLNQALIKKNINVTVNSIINDTVGTLILQAYRDAQTRIGVILGTGTNAAYVENLKNIPKWKGQVPEGGKMIINTEWGAFDNGKKILPITEYDNLVDSSSVAPNSQVFEKMVSGMYLGEIVRFILLDLAKKYNLFGGSSFHLLEKKWSFETSFLSRIERDHSTDLIDTKTILENFFQIYNTSLTDREYVKEICELVGIRAARLTLAGIASILILINRLDGCTVAIDGSVFEHYPHFTSRMRDALLELVGISAENIVFEQVRDGSGQGAALVAACCDTLKTPFVPKDVHKKEI